MKKVLVFGTFDGLHVGHNYFLNYAKVFGDMLVVSVARDSVVENLKKKKTKRTELERMRDLSEAEIADIVVLGDETLGQWSAMHDYKPETVVVGYDQNALAEALEAARENFPFQFTILRAPGHKPDIFKSSLLN